MVIPRTFLSKSVILTPEGWQATVWRRPRETIFSKAHTHLFSTEDEAREYLRSLWREGNLTEEGKKAKFTTKSVWWISDELVLTKAYADLPDVTTTVEDGLVKVWVDGTQIAEGKALVRQPIKGLKRQIAAHPLGECLLARTCYMCRRLPTINLVDRTLSHVHKDCFTKFRMAADPLTPIAVQIAAWNREIAPRIIAASARPMVRPDFMVIGVLREANEQDHLKKIRKIESLVIDK